MVGDINTDYVIKWMEQGALSTVLGLLLASKEQLCHKYARNILCHAVYPKCDSDKQQVIYPCKESCNEFSKACSQNVMRGFQKLQYPESEFRRWWLDKEKLGNCDYLPSLSDPNYHCFYKPVACKSPPNVTNTKIITRTESNGTYLAMSQVEYECLNKAFKMEGNSIVTCLYSGHWTEMPRCLERKDKGLNPLIIVVPLLVPLLVSLL